MEDKNGTKIWDGDYVVGLTDSGDVCEGIVTGKHPVKPYVKVMDDNGDEVWLKNYRTEVQTPESLSDADYFEDLLLSPSGYRQNGTRELL